MVTRRGAYSYVGGPDRMVWIKWYTSDSRIVVVKVGRLWLSWFPNLQPRFKAFIEPKATEDR